MSTTTTTTTTTESTTSYHFLPKEVVKAITPMSELNLKMKISSTFNSNLNNSTSSEYKNLTDLIKTEVIKIFIKKNNSVNLVLNK